MLADAQDLDTTWDRIGGETAAAYRRAEAYASSHCELGQVE
jgi:hypothetical protein